MTQKISNKIKYTSRIIGKKRTLIAVRRHTLGLFMMISFVLNLFGFGELCATFPHGLSSQSICNCMLKNTLEIEMSARYFLN